MGTHLSTEQPIDEQFEERSQGMSVEPQSLSQPNRLRNPLAYILTEILTKKAKLDEDLVKENNAILNDFLKTFIAEMKGCDKTFALLFQEIYYTGSYYSDLRVSRPDEYDLNIKLKFPFKSVNVEFNSQVPSYVKYSITDESNISKYGLTRLFENGYLMPNKVQKWLQGVVAKARTTYHFPRGIAAIKDSHGGPAKTIILVKTNGGVIDIDLVPVFECSVNKPPGINGNVYAKVAHNLQCFIVPKPYQPSKQAPVNALEISRLWRSHYPKAEADIIHNIGCVKPVIKLLKLLRDKENWKILASYYLKTVVMWMILDNSDPEYWKENHLGERFLEALKKLQKYVTERRIPYLFSSRYNLLEKMTEAHASPIYNRLANIIREVERDNKKLYYFFECCPTYSL